MTDKQKFTLLKKSLDLVFVTWLPKDRTESETNGIKAEIAGRTAGVEYVVKEAEFVTLDCTLVRGTGELVPLFRITTEDWIEGLPAIVDGKAN
jgi:hypothetical protein